MVDSSQSHREMTPTDHMLKEIGELERAQAKPVYEVDDSMFE